MGVPFRSWVGGGSSATATACRIHGHRNGLVRHAERLHEGHWWEWTDATDPYVRKQIRIYRRLRAQFQSVPAYDEVWRAPDTHPHTRWPT